MNVTSNKIADGQDSAWTTRDGLKDVLEKAFCRAGAIHEYHIDETINEICGVICDPGEDVKAPMRVAMSIALEQASVAHLWDDVLGRALRTLAGRLTFR